jgi:hypothetical protein
MADNSMPGTLGTISGIMSSIKTEAEIALNHSANVGGYRETLQRILAGAIRAEEAWSRYIDSELPEHKEINT